MKKLIIGLLFLVVVLVGYADTQYIITNPVFHVDNPNTGGALSGGKVYFYEPGTTTPKNTYSNSTGSTLNTNPVVLDSAGNATIYGASTYKIVIKSAGGTTLSTVDNVQVSQVSTAFSNEIMAATDAATIRGLLDLGSAAVLDASDGPLGLVQLEADGKLPHLNASNLTGFATSQILLMPRGYLSGFKISNTVGDASGSITISAGSCRDIADATNIVSTWSITKAIDSNWSAGTGQGGMRPNGAVAADTWYHVYVMSSTTATEVVDAIISTVAEANISGQLPGGYAAIRRIGSIRTGSDSGIIAFNQSGDKFIWSTPKVDYKPINSTTSNLPAAGEYNIALSYVPTGVDIEADVNVYSVDDDNNGNSFSIYPNNVIVDQPPVNQDNRITWIKNPVDARITNAYSITLQHPVASVASVFIPSGSPYFKVRTNWPGGYMTVVTLGWVDRRGRDD